MDLSTLQQQLANHAAKQPPVEQWDPPFCGDIDLIIKHDGRWLYMGSPIGRKALVKLFASVLKREGDDYFLVTPVEKVGIQVEDVPLLITQWRWQDDNLMMFTDTDDPVVIDATHPLALQQDRVTGEQLPYVNVRRNLWARLHQNVYYQLVEAGTPQQLNGEPHLVIHSAGIAYPLGKLAPQD
ncbi:DUF1285 domain-containing protein [Aestuariibacter halophilus]|uniref:DUF1285 domain-containing protein n=1 Tax=Fluctibacter halophilus TaxID=226011 RepID=A0ABS8GAX4_9ALTE|nr:DUF1285 domain-containing protein [Aestuariibacter halophilus]MCC2616965.1 DUF1285 domain-containing protein [Aestuariibacter halophilus]